MGTKFAALWAALHLLVRAGLLPVCHRELVLSKQTDRMLFLGCKFPKLFPHPPLQPHSGKRRVFPAIIGTLKYWLNSRGMQNPYIS